MVNTIKLELLINYKHILHYNKLGCFFLLNTTLKFVTIAEAHYYRIVEQICKFYMIGSRLEKEEKEELRRNIRFSTCTYLSFSLIASSSHTFSDNCSGSSDNAVFY